MKKQKYASALKSAITEKMGFKMIAMGLLAVNVLLAIRVTTADTSEKTIVTPPGFNKPFWVKGSEVSGEYVEQMARHIMNYLKTYQSSIARYQFDEIARYAHPSIAAAFKSQLNDDVSRIERNSLGSVYYITNIDIRKNAVYVEGDLVGSVGSQFLEPKRKLYQIDYTYDGNFYLMGFKEVVRQGKDGYADVDAADIDDEVVDQSVNGIETQSVPDAQNGKPTPNELGGMNTQAYVAPSTPITSPVTQYSVQQPSGAR